MKDKRVNLETALKYAICQIIDSLERIEEQALAKNMSRQEFLQERLERLQDILSPRIEKLEEEIKELSKELGNDAKQYALREHIARNLDSSPEDAQKHLNKHVVRLEKQRKRKENRKNSAQERIDNLQSEINSLQSFAANIHDNFGRFQEMATNLLENIDPKKPEEMQKILQEIYSGIRDEIINRDGGSYKGSLSLRKLEIKDDSFYEIDEAAGFLIRAAIFSSPAIMVTSLFGLPSGVRDITFLVTIMLAASLSFEMSDFKDNPFKVLQPAHALLNNIVMGFAESFHNGVVDGFNQRKLRLATENLPSLKTPSMAEMNEYLANFTVRHPDLAHLISSGVQQVINDNQEVLTELPDSGVYINLEGELVDNPKYKESGNRGR